MKNTWVSPKSLLCPISPLRVGETTARVTGGLAAALIGVYALTGAGTIPLALAIDYGLRASIRWQHSPLSWLAAHLVRGLGLPDRPIDRAPKLFAARIAVLLLLVTSILTLIHPPSGLLIGLVLMGFALLEFVLNICVGCLIYRYAMLPLFTQREDADGCAGQ